MWWLLIAVIAVIPAILSFSLRKAKEDDKKLLEFSASRQQITKEEYVACLKEKGYDELIVNELYDTFHYYLPGGFVMHPEDDLYQLYKFDPEDLEDIIIAHLKKNKMKFPGEETMSILNKEYSDKMTIEYLLEVISFSRQK